jgi:sugar lactone lactonase YvrE
VLNRPRAAAADAAGNVYIVQRGEWTGVNTVFGAVRRITTEGIIRRFAGTYDNSAPAPDSASPALASSITGLSGVAVDRSGNVLIADEVAGKVRRIDPGGTMTTILSGLSSALGMAADDAGNAYVATAGDGRVRKISAAGVATVVAGTGSPGFNGDGIPATTAQLAGPGGVAVDSAGNVLIADGARVRRVAAATGLISTIAGTGTGGFTGDNGAATSAQVNATGIAVDRAGNVYIAEGAVGHRIRRIATNGVITTIAGNGTPGFAGNGGPASGAVLNTPFGISVDGTGSLLIGDEGSSTVRRIVNTPPVASFGATPGSGLTPLAVGFDGSASSGVNDGIVSHSWDFGDGATASGATTSHTYAAAGAFTVTLRVMDASGAVSSTTRAVTAIAPALRISGARFAPKWKASRVGGLLVLTGSADRATRFEARILKASGKGKALLTRRFRIAAAGAFTRRLALGGRLLPGPLLIRVADVGPGAKLPARELRATLAAPPEGVASLAAVSTALGGRARARIPRGPGIIFASFRLVALPKKGRSLTVTWFFSGAGGPISTDPKPRTPRITAFLRSRAGALQAGSYRAELRAGRALVAVARTRIR